MKKIGIKKQREMIENRNLSPITFEYDGCEIQFNPVVTADDAQKFSEILWSICFCADDNGVFDYRPYLIEAGARIVAFKLWTNIDLDLSDFDHVYQFVMQSGLYEELYTHFTSAHLDVFYAAKEYVQYRYELLMKPSNMDDLIEMIGGWFKSFADTYKDIDMKEVLGAINKINSANDDEKILDMIFRDTEDDVDGELSNRSEGVTG